jgi:myo-inositol catabolism protein IolC
MDIGYDRPLYIMPFDHRSSFEKGLFGFSPPLTAEQTATVAATKQVVDDGLKLALTKGVPREAAGILVDEQYGAVVLRDARANGLITCAPAEKSGQWSSSSNTATATPSTSPISSRTLSRCWCATTLKATRR